MQNLKVTLIQSDIVWQSVEDNCSGFNSLVQSIDSETDLVVLPEMFNTGFTMEPENLAGDMNSSTVFLMREWAELLKAFIAGSIIIKERSFYYNRMIIAGPGGEIHTYDKRHLFRMAGEDRIYTPGNENITIDIKGWRVRPFLCYDLRFPVWTRNSGNCYDLAIYAANWPAARSSQWDTLLRARAIENQCYVAGVNRTGVDGKGVKYNGDSCIAGFRGETIFTAGSGICVRTEELSSVALQEYRRDFPAWMDADEFRID